MQHGGGSIMWCVALGLLVVSLTNSLFTQLLILLYGLFISLQHQPPHARLSLSELMLKKILACADASQELRENSVVTEKSC